MTTNLPAQNKRLTREQLMENIRLLMETADKIRDFRFDQKLDGKITSQQFAELGVEERKIRDLVDQLALLIFDSIITDLQTPGEKLQATMIKVNKALSRLAEVNRIISIVGKVVNLFASVTLAISTGNLAQIATVVKQVEDLLILV
jgi:hypothetical protein